jgi:hypothetical protein
MPYQYWQRGRLVISARAVAEWDARESLPLRETLERESWCPELDIVTMNLVINGGNDDNRIGALDFILAHPEIFLAKSYFDYEEKDEVTRVWLNTQSGELRFEEATAERHDWHELHMMTVKELQQEIMTVRRRFTALNDELASRTVRA